MAAIQDARAGWVGWRGREKGTLKPLLGSENLSKSSVSRIVSRLKAYFTAWRERDLTDEVYAILDLDGFHVKVRMARRVVSVPVLAVLGVAEDGSNDWSSRCRGLPAALKIP